MSSSSAPLPNDIQCSMCCPREEYDVVNPLYNKLAESELSEKETVLLSEFQRRVAEANPNLSTAQCTVTLIKFLRARSWDLDKAFTMIQNRQQWISEFKPHHIDPAKTDFSPLIKQGKMFWYGRDKLNRPVFVFKGGKHVPNASQNDLFFKFLIYLCEYGQSLLPPPPANQLLIVYDRLNFGLSNYDLGLFKRVQIVANYYPELLYKAYICRPNFFLKTVWKAASTFVDPNILQKIKMPESINKLQRDVEKYNLPMSLGGYGLCVPFPESTPIDDDTPNKLKLSTEERDEKRKEHAEDVQCTIDLLHHRQQ